MQRGIHSCCQVQSSRPLCEGLRAQVAEQRVDSRTSQALRSAFSCLAFASALLMPKCPLCVAAWAAAIGLSAAGQRLLLNWLDPRYRPALILLLALPLLAQIAVAMRPLAERINSRSTRHQRDPRS